MVDMTGTDWKRVATEVVARRTALGMTTSKALADRAQLTTRVIGDIENARRTNYSQGTLAQIENALNWKPGSIELLLAGEDPVVAAVIRDRSGSPMQTFEAIHGSEQETLQLLRLGQVVLDARDIAQSQPGPMMSAIAALLDEASDLATRAFARVNDDDLDHARWRIDEVRATNQIRRHGDVYVVEELSPVESALREAVRRTGERITSSRHFGQKDFDLVSGDRRFVGEVKGERLREHLDQQAEVGDPEGPEGGA